MLCSHVVWTVILPSTRLSCGTYRATDGNIGGQAGWCWWTSNFIWKIDLVSTCRLCKVNLFTCSSTLSLFKVKFAKRRWSKAQPTCSSLHLMPELKRMCAAICSRMRGACLGRATAGLQFVHSLATAKLRVAWSFLHRKHAFPVEIISDKIIWACFEDNTCLLTVQEPVCSSDFR